MASTMPTAALGVNSPIIHNYVPRLPRLGMARAAQCRLSLRKSAFGQTASRPQVHYGCCRGPGCRSSPSSLRSHPGILVRLPGSC